MKQSAICPIFYYFTVLGAYFITWSVAWRNSRPFTGNRCQTRLDMLSLYLVANTQHLIKLYLQNY